MKRQKKKMRLTLTFDAVSTLELFLHHGLDAAAGDDRPDHGLAMMKKFRKESRWELAYIIGRLKRWRFKHT